MKITNVKVQSVQLQAQVELSESEAQAMGIQADQAALAKLTLGPDGQLAPAPGSLQLVTHQEEVEDAEELSLLDPGYDATHDDRDEEVRNAEARAERRADAEAQYKNEV